MRKCMVFLLVFLPVAIGAQHVTISFDVGQTLSLMASDTVRMRCELGFTVNEEVALCLPVSLTQENYHGGLGLLETGLSLEYRPFARNLFLRFSLLQLGWLTDEVFRNEDEALVFLNECALGYTFGFAKGLYLQPQVLLLDPNKVFSDEYTRLASHFTEFPMVRFSLLVGWSFPVPAKSLQGEGEAMQTQGEGGLT